MSTEPSDTLAGHHARRPGHGLGGSESDRLVARAGALTAIGAASHAVVAATAELDGAVAAAVAAGATWDQIGRAAGMTRQTAHRRWAGVEFTTAQAQQILCDAFPDAVVDWGARGRPAVVAPVTDPPDRPGTVRQLLYPRVYPSLGDGASGWIAVYSDRVILGEDHTGWRVLVDAGPHRAARRPPAG